MERSTSQRQAIRHVLEEADHPLKPHEILAVAKHDVPGLGIATVYRTIKSLIEDGWLVPVDLPGETARYEVANRPHHHHFLCRRCDRVFVLDGCPWNMRATLPAGFKLESHQVILYGICKDCRKGH